MKNFLIRAILVVYFFTFQCYVQAFEVVYPKVKNRTITSDTTFFIGSSKTPITINNIPIKLHHTGAFAHFVFLRDGMNTFTIKSENKEETFVVIKNRQIKSNSNSILKQYKNKQYLIVEKDNTPLRKTSLNIGINRMAHLSKGTLLIANGEKAEFYRIELGKDKNAWVDKRNVKQIEEFSPAQLLNYEFAETENDYILTFHLDKKIPFSITENDLKGEINLDFYNTDREHNFSFKYKEKTGSDRFWGYSGEYINNKNWDFVLKIRKPPLITKEKPLKDLIITLDAGHGGSEKGAIGCFGDEEKDIVFKITKLLEKELKSRGAIVVMTRNGDFKTGLYDRVEKANKNNSIFFISIHGNALPDTLNPNEHRGTSVYYYYNQAENFAKTVLNTMIQELGTVNDNVHQKSFAVIRNTNAISILIEVAYMINPDDNELLTNSDFQKKTAITIANGIEKYILQNNLSEKNKKL